jgi:hypothetical protein
MAGFLSLLLTLSFLAMLVLLIFHPFPDANKDILLTGLGVLFGGATKGWDYFLGSSQGSQDKSILLAKAPPVPDSSVPPVPPVEPQ